MSGPVFLGIDVGTTSVKAAVVGLDASVLGTASREYSTHFGRPGEVEQSPEVWWACTIAVLDELRTLLGGFDRVGGVGVSAQAPTLLALDREGRPVRDALIWMDRRAQPQAELLASRHDELDYVRTRGNRIDPFYVAPKIMWLRAAEPAAFERATTFVQITGYLVSRLTGALTIDEQHASLLALRAPGATDWDADALEETGITADALPPVHAATDVVGTVTAEAARRTGIPPGTPVVAGTVDSAAAAIEVDALRPGVATEMTGTSTVVVMPSVEPRPDPAFITMASPVGGEWLNLAAVVASGASLKWLRDVAAVGADYAAVTTLAAQSGAGAGGVRFVPHLMGERSPLWDSDLRGTLTGMTLATGVPELARAVLEGTAFALRHNLRIAAELGLRPEELRSTGAPTTSDLWCQIKADVTGLPVSRVRTPTGAAFGDAVLAAVGVGAVDSFADFAEGTDRIDRVFEPESAAHERYGELFEQYLQLITALAPVQHRAADAERRRLADV